MNNSLSIVRLFLNSRTGLSAISGVFQTSLNLCLVLVSYPIYLSMLGAELYGLWASLSIIIVLSQMGSLGLHVALAKYIASVNTDLKEVWNLIGASLSVTLLICGILVLGCILLVNDFVGILELDGNNAQVAISILPLIGFLSSLILVLEILKGIIIGFGYMYKANLIASACRILQLVFSVIFLSLGHGVIGLLWGAAIAHGIMGLWLLLISLRLLDKNFQNIFTFNKSHISKLCGSGVRIASTATFGAIIDSTTKVLIAKEIGLSGVTVYEAGHKILQLTQSIFDSGARAIMPKISRLSATSNLRINEIRGVRDLAIKFIAGLMLPVFALLYFYGDPLMSFWLQTSYDERMFMVMKIFMIGYAFNILSIPYYHVCVGLNKTGDLFYASSLRIILFSLATAVLMVSGVITLTTFVAIASLSMIPEAYKFIVSGLKITTYMGKA